MLSIAEMKAKFIEVKSIRGTSCSCDFNIPFIWTVNSAGKSLRQFGNRTPLQADMQSRETHQKTIAIIRQPPPNLQQKAQSNIQNFHKKNDSSSPNYSTLLLQLPPRYPAERPSKPRNSTNNSNQSCKFRSEQYVSRSISNWTREVLSFSTGP